MWSARSAGISIDSRVRVCRAATFFGWHGLTATTSRDQPCNIRERAGACQRSTGYGATGLPVGHREFACSQGRRPAVLMSLLSSIAGPNASRKILLGQLEYSTGLAAELRAGREDEHDASLLKGMRAIIPRAACRLPGERRAVDWNFILRLRPRRANHLSEWQRDPVHTIVVTVQACPPARRPLSR